MIGDLIVVAHSDVVGHVVGVLHTGHRQGVGVGAGVAQHAVVRVGGEVGVEAEGVALAHGVGVTGGDAQHGAGLSHPVKHLVDPVHVGGEACIGAQAHVDHIGAQHHGVFHAGHPVLGVGAAVGAEHLHHHQLGVGGHTHHLGLVHLVGGGDAGHVGAVVALGVVVMGDVQAVVHVVEAVGNLGVVVQIGAGQATVALIGVEAGEHAVNVGLGQAGVREHFVGESGEVLVIGVQSGVDDGNFHALTLVALGPGVLTANHLAVGDGPGIDNVGRSGLVGGAGLVHGLHDHLVHAVHGLNVGQLAIGHGGSHAIDQPAVLVGHGEVVPVQSGLLDVGDDLVLGGLDLFHLGCGVVGVHSGAVGGDHGVAVHDNDDPHILVRRDGVVQVVLGHGVVPGQVQVVVGAVQLLHFHTVGLGGGSLVGVRAGGNGEGGIAHGDRKGQAPGENQGQQTVQFHFAALLLA